MRQRDSQSAQRWVRETVKHILYNFILIPSVIPLDTPPLHPSPPPPFNPPPPPPPPPKSPLAYQKKIINNTQKNNKFCNLLKFVLVLLSASIQRVGVSRMRDFFYIHLKMSLVFGVLTTMNCKIDDIIWYYRFIWRDLFKAKVGRSKLIKKGSPACIKTQNQKL